MRKDIVLVNKDHKIDKNYLQRITLVAVNNVEGGQSLLEEETAIAYGQLKKILLEQGIELGLDSGYRSLKDQQQIYDEFTEKYGKEYADTIVAPVGTSEHHTGLALDFTLKVENSFDQENQDIFNHLNLYQAIVPYFSDFGFILRYPQEKEVVTGYPYEPWHIRYVGITAAKEMEEHKEVLEEYITRLKNSNNQKK